MICRQLLAIDLGTTYFKAALFDSNGESIAIARTPSPFVHAGDGRVESTLAGFHSAVERLLTEVAGGATDGLRRVTAISYASQANTFVLLGEDDQPLTPIISWTDTRATACASDSLNSLNHLRDITGVAAIGGEFAIAKMRWLFARQPELRTQARRVAFLEDLLVAWLCGRHTIEAASASLTGLADARRLCWWDEAVGTLDAPNLAWPAIVRAGTDLGEVRASLAGRFRIHPSARVVSGCLDQCAGAIGTGAIEDATACETTGTVLAVLKLDGSFAVAADVVSSPSYRADQFFHMTFSTTSANLLEWYRTYAVPGWSFAKLLSAAENATDSARIGRVFRPDDLTHAFPSSLKTIDPAEVVHGIVDRVNDELADLLATLGSMPRCIRSAGGAARSNWWSQKKADRLGIPVMAMAAIEPTCLGAAILGASAVGMGSVEELARRWCRPRVTFEPVQRLERT